MRIGVIGGGFTGLTAALRLSQKGHAVVIFEKETKVGGLATGFKEPGWEWSLERAYHHWFTNDSFALGLARELDYQLLIERPKTDVFIKGACFPLDSPLSLLTFPYLSIIDRLRTGLTTLYLKLVNDYQDLEGQKALPWIKKWMGHQAYRTIWDPLFTGKFGRYKNGIALTWFWARIKKRTSSLAYPVGGFENFANRLKQEIEHYGGKIFLNTPVERIKSDKKMVTIYVNDRSSMIDNKFDKIIVTLPTPLFVKITKGLPDNFAKRITSINHLHALNLVLISEKPFMDKTYWLNITEKDFPFLVLVEHTNFMDPKYYGNSHILYIGNYLPQEHRYFKMTKEELLKEFTPFLKKINSNFQFHLSSFYVFIGPFAQPIVTVNYPKLIPTFETPLQNVFLANLDMIYPWDRGTNYAIELGEKVARLIS